MQPVKLTEATGSGMPIETASEVTGYYVGSEQDLIGKSSVEPDGILDCLVRIDGLPAGKKIGSATLSGPREGVWLSYKNPQRWLLKTDWQDNHLMLAFTYWAAGQHQLDITFDDGSKQSVLFHIPPSKSPWFDADLQVAESNVHVIRKREPEYTEVMTSCLKNLLDSFPVTAASAPGEGR